MDGRFVDSGPAVFVGDGAKSTCKDKTLTCVFIRSHTSQQSMCKDKKWTVGLLTQGPAVIVGDGRKSMCKDKKRTCVFLRSHTSQQPMCKDKKWAVGLLTRCLPSLSATEQNPCVKMKSGRAFSFGRRQVNNPCVKIKIGRSVR